MPNVQRAKLPQTNTRDLPGPDVTYDIRGTSLAGAGADIVKQVLPQVQQADQEKRSKFDDDAVTKAHSDLIAWQQHNIYANREQNPDAALVQEGEAALNLTPRYQGEHTKTGEKILAGLANDDQRTKFKKVLLAEDEQVFRTLNGHERTQYELKTAADYKSSIDLEVAKATRAYDEARGLDMPTLTNAIATGVGIVEMRARNQGVPAKEQEARKLEFTSRALVGVITNMRDKNPTAAMEIYNQSKTLLDFNTDEVRRLETSIQSVGDRFVGLREAEALVSSSTTESEALAKLAEKSKAGALRPEAARVAREEITSLNNAKRGARDAEDKDTYQRALDRSVTARGWTPYTDPEWDRLKDTGYQWALVEKWRAHNRSVSNDEATRRWQDSVDAEFERNFQARYNLEDPDALSGAYLDDPKKTGSLVSSGALPTDKSVANARKFASQGTKKVRTDTQRISRSSFVARVKTWVTTNEMLKNRNPDYQTDVVNAAMSQYDALEEKKGGANPTYEETNAIYSQMIQSGLADPGAWFDTEPMTYAEAVLKGKTGTWKANFVRIKDAKGNIRRGPRAEWNKIRGDPKYKDWTEVTDAQ